MLQLVDVKKDYAVDKTLTTHALKGVSLKFGERGFVAILGPSGCGKTTLLNIVSGLDRYTAGDLIVDGVSTAEFKDRDWDDYRNKKIGIVFQSYNLIPHLTVWENTALALTLAGLSPKEKRAMAYDALKSVGLSGQEKKKPNQLSGGQQQRVAIARALVSNPSIILADEPTGALDSDTSIQVMDILEKISKDHLVVMVTHNEALADRYADRIIRMSDGKIVGDVPNRPQTPILSGNAAPTIHISSQPPTPPAHSEGGRRSRMTFATAMAMSLKNLLTKKGRTAVTAVASSFGIIGVGLVLAISGGFSDYVSRMETQTLAKFPISIEGYGLSEGNSNSNENNTGEPDENLESYPEGDQIAIRDPGRSAFHLNDITADYYESFLMGGTDSYGRRWEGLDPSLYASIQNNYSISANVIAKSVDDDGRDLYTAIDTSPRSMLATLTTTTYWSELPGDESYIEESYDILPGGRFPSSSHEVVITVDKYNRISTSTLRALGINPNSFKNADGTYRSVNTQAFGQWEFKRVKNDDFYTSLGPSESPFFGLGLRNAGNGNPQANPYSFPKFVKYLNASPENPSEAERNEYVQGLLNFFIPTDAETSGLDPLELVQLYSILSKLQRDLQGAQGDQASQQAILHQFWAENQTFLTTVGEKAGVNLFEKNLATYSKPQGNDNLKAAFDNPNSQPIQIVGILRPKEGVALGLLGDGVYHLPSLTREVLEESSKSSIATENDKYYFFLNARTLAQGGGADFENIQNGNYAAVAYENYLEAYDILTYDPLTRAPKKLTPFTGYSSVRTSIGTDTSVGSITIFPMDFKRKEEILTYLDRYNATPDQNGNPLAEEDKIIYTDVSAMLSDSIGTMVSMISTVLISFASISLVVSSVMIGIIIYVSVLERTKEIGILRSVGARKRDIGRLFKMESVAIGFMAGAFGVAVTYVLSFPINAIVNALYPDYDVGSIASLRYYYALLLIAVSSLLTYLAGLLPSRSAAKKNPVKCLRSE